MCPSSWPTCSPSQVCFTLLNDAYHPISWCPVSGQPGPNPQCWPSPSGPSMSGSPGAGPLSVAFPLPSLSQHPLQRLPVSKQNMFAHHRALPLAGSSPHQLCGPACSPQLLDLTVWVLQPLVIGQRGSREELGGVAGTVQVYCIQVRMTK